jgi:exonuclease SbcC
MIPIQLSISGFLSYRDAVEIDFSRFNLACIAGPNGAGKSSLLDAMTWALFGVARKSNDTIINAQSTTAKVGLVFAYENNLYRVQRAKPRDKTAMLEFHILQQGDDLSIHISGFSGAWKPLTERSLRETEQRIQETLRMDYETFTNASFFLQGKADQFTQQRPSDRKRILSSVLGLEIWERYKEQAGERRKAVEAQVRELDGRLAEIHTELAEEAARRTRLSELQTELKRLGQLRQAQQQIVEQAGKEAARLDEQARWVETLRRTLEAGERRLQELRARCASRQAEMEVYAAAMQHASEIEAAYAGWQTARTELEQIERLANRYRDLERLRDAPRQALQEGRARLEQEARSLAQRQAEIDAAGLEAESLQGQLLALETQIAQAEVQLDTRADLEGSLREQRQRQDQAEAENKRLKVEMDELKERLDLLSASDGTAGCPLCGQPLAEAERLALLERMTAQGKDMGARYRANQAAAQELVKIIPALANKFDGLKTVETKVRQLGAQRAALLSRVELQQKAAAEWELTGAARFAEIRRALDEASFEPEAHRRLAELDAGLAALGYNPVVHEAARQAEETGRAAEMKLRDLEKARAALAPLEREIGEMQTQMAALEAESVQQRGEFESAAAALAAARAGAVDLGAAEDALYQLQEQEGRMRQDLGAAQRNVEHLEVQKVKEKELEAQREAQGREVGRYKQLERAFSKDGVPALLIEQALPEIEGKANDILARLSDGGMSVRFVTQAAYKDKSRDDLRETLDIQISDGAGTREYELFSGGEAFRVNFAIRLALSEVLAQRAGARLQTLVIDEGFGSQDNLGRQRLVEAINMVRPDFAKILVITHIDELKDAFPNRIEVEKTLLGSSVRII